MKIENLGTMEKKLDRFDENFNDFMEKYLNFLMLKLFCVWMV